MASLRISPDCEQFSSLDQGGALCIWRFHSGSDMPLPFTRLQCHTKRGADLCFVDSSVLLATAGLSQASNGAGSGGSLCLWDVLLPPSQALVASSNAHVDGARCVLHCAADASLWSGGERGEMTIFDLRQRRVREKWSAHTLAVQAMALADERSCISASADADIKLWSVGAPCVAPVEADGTGSVLAEGAPRGRWPNAHEPHTLLAPLVGTKLGHSGVTALTLMAANPSVGKHSASIVTGGADGKVKLWKSF